VSLLSPHPLTSSKHERSARRLLRDTRGRRASPAPPHADRRGRVTEGQRGSLYISSPGVPISACGRQGARVRLDPRNHANTGAERALSVLAPHTCRAVQTNSSNRSGSGRCMRRGTNGVASAQACRVGPLENRVRAVPSTRGTISDCSVSCMTNEPSRMRPLRRIRPGSWSQCLRS
jgi:hypothetical protein